MRLLPLACLAGFFLLLLLFPPSSSAAIPPSSCPKDYVCLMPPGTSITTPENELSAPPTSFRCVGTAYNAVVGSVDWDALLVQIAKEHKLDPNWLCTLIKKETGGKIGAVGLAGECDGFQIMPNNVKNYGYAYYSNIEAGRGDPKSCFVPANNAEIAASMFQNLYYNVCNRDLQCAFRRYNGSGPAAEKYAQDALRINSQNKELNPGYGVA